VSSTYIVLCLAHDPALVVASGIHTADAVLADLAAGIAGHETCDLLIGRVSGALVELGCPPTHMQHPDNKPCHDHADTHWTHVDVLRLLATAHRSHDPRVTTTAAAPTFRHWPNLRLNRLRLELDLPQ
jgi:hypothetical protein